MLLSLAGEGLAEPRVRADKVGDGGSHGHLDGGDKLASEGRHAKKQRGGAGFFLFVSDEY
ncbi:hypothetical protein PG994_005643 [Apiospora phragmitis]|uniref:Uncharacterized protein n=1 Tax=Apiospora phragmitis TaxID=2905665 RepID=A0ABR1VCW3_9PEZI